jgi:hypothetical protein
MRSRKRQPLTLLHLALTGACVGAPLLAACGDDSGGVEASGGGTATTLGAGEPSATGTASGPNGSGGSGSGAGDTGSGGLDEPVDPSDPIYAACGGLIFDPETGQLDAAEYERQARLWDRDAIDCRLGPTWEALNPGGEDDRPEVFGPENDPGRVCGGGNAFQLYDYGPTGCAQDCTEGGFDYQSTAGQLVYEPDDASAFGVDRLTFQGVAGALVATRPQLGPPRESAHPDQDLLAPLWPERGFSSGQAIAVSRSKTTGGYSSHQGLAVFEDGFVGGVGTITDGVSGGLDILQVGFKFPDHIVPTDVAISSHSELAFVTVWDTEAHEGRLAVFAMHSNFPLFDLQTWWYVGLPSSGAFTGMKLLGYVDLPMKTPTSLAVVTNGIQQNGPHATGGRRLGEFALIADGACDPAVGAEFSLEVEEPTQLADIVASQGYAIVASRWEHTVALVDLSPLLGDLRRAYLEDTEFCTEHVAPAHVWNGADHGIDGNPGPYQFDGEDRWPYPFVRETTEGPTIVPPVVAATFEVDAPIDVEAGMERVGDQAPRAFILQQDGSLQVVYPERLFGFWPTGGAWSDEEPRLGPTVDVCEHPTSMNLRNSNSGVAVACRGDRAVHGVSFDGETASVSDALRDTLLDDPVAIAFDDRSPLWTVADFHGRRVVNYQMGDIAFSCSSVPLQTPGVPQRGGSMDVEGTPWLLSSANVN